MLQRIHSSSICLRHAVIQFKMVNWVHWSKAKLSKIRPDLDPTCDRCKQAPDTLLDMTKTDIFLDIIFFCRFIRYWRDL